MLDFCKMAGNETGYAMLGVFGEISCPPVMNFARVISLTNLLHPNIVYPMLTAWLFFYFLSIYPFETRQSSIQSY